MTEFAKPPKNVSHHSKGDLPMCLEVVGNISLQVRKQQEQIQCEIHPLMSAANKNRNLVLKMHKRNRRARVKDS
jgi:hypothetical protein